MDLGQFLGMVSKTALVIGGILFAWLVAGILAYYIYIHFLDRVRRQSWRQMEMNLEVAKWEQRYRATHPDLVDDNWMQEDLKEVPKRSHDA